MPPSRAQPARASIASINLLIGLLFALISLAAMLWLGGMTAALVSGHPAPHASMLAGLRMLAHPGNPRLAWHSAMPGAAWYWACTGVVIAAVAALACLGIRWYRRTGSGSSAHPRHTPGLAERADITRVASTRTVTRRSVTVRPTLASRGPSRSATGSAAPAASTCGLRQDSMVILGPPAPAKAYT
jgi:hypothetical protein